MRKNLAKSRQPDVTATKVVEGNGTSNHFGLVKTNPFPIEVCDRAECVLYVKEDGKNTSCDKSNVGYAGKCVRCPDKAYKYWRDK